MTSRYMPFSVTDEIAEQLHAKYAVVIDGENVYHGNSKLKFLCYGLKAKLVGYSYGLFWQ